MKFLSRINRPAKELDTRIHVKRALRDALGSVDEFMIDAMDLKHLARHTEEMYYAELEKLKFLGGDADMMHKIEKLELAMSLARNLLYSQGEVHPTEAFAYA